MLHFYKQIELNDKKKYIYIGQVLSKENLHKKKNIKTYRQNINIQTSNKDLMINALYR